MHSAQGQRNPPIITFNMISSICESGEAMECEWKMTRRELSSCCRFFFVCVPVSCVSPFDILCFFFFFFFFGGGGRRERVVNKRSHRGHYNQHGQSRLLPTWHKVTWSNFNY